MRSSYEKIDATQTRVDITITRDDWRKAENKIYAEFASEVQVPGFRPGKAPKNVIERHIGPKQIFDAIKEEVVNNTILAAIKEHKLVPIRRPDINLDQLNELNEMPKTGDFTFTMTVEVWPEVPEFNYKDLKIYVRTRPVTEEDIDKAIESLKLRNAQTNEVTDRPAQHGDWVTFRFKGTVNPEADAKPEGEGGAPEPFVMENVFNIHLGYDESIPGIPEALIGLKKDEEKDFEIIVPETFNPEHLRGRQMKSHVAVLRVNEMILPELTDEYLKDKFGLENMDDLRANMRLSMENSSQELKRKEANEALEDYFINSVPLSIPSVFIESRKEQILEDMHAYYKRQNQDLDEIMRDKEQAEKIMNNIGEEAHNQVRLEMVYDEISRREKIEVGAEEVRNYVYTMRNIKMMKDKDLKKLLKDENFILSVRNDIKNRKVIDFLLDKNKIIEIEDPTKIEKRVEEPVDETPSESTTPDDADLQEPDEPEELEEPEDDSEVDETDSLPDNEAE
jgi:trigger factor